MNCQYNLLVENLELIYAINDKDYIYIKFISLCYAHYWRYLFCVYSLSIPSTPPVVVNGTCYLFSEASP